MGNLGEAVWGFVFLGFAFWLGWIAREWQNDERLGVLAGSQVLRGVWYVVVSMTSKDSLLPRLLNRCAMLVQFVGVCLVARWFNNMRNALFERVTDEISRIVAARDEKRATLLFFVANVFLWCFTLGTATSTNLMYQLNLTAIALAFCCVSAGLLGASRRLAVEITLLADRERASGAQAERLARRSVFRSKIVTAAALLTALFTLRAFVLLFHFSSTTTGIGKTGVERDLYPWFYYQLPELVADFFIVLLLAPRDSLFSVDAFIEPYFVARDAAANPKTAALKSRFVANPEKDLAGSYDIM